MAKKDSKRLVKIAPKELENRFNSARREIVKSIQDDYLSKIADFDEKLSSLRLYEDIGTPDHDVIQSKFKGEYIQKSDDSSSQKFDM